MSAIATDHIEELLLLVLRFTRARRRILTHNLRRMDREGFVPQDLPVQEFAEQVQAAIAEHVRHRRLILRDNAHVRFGARGHLEVLVETDHLASKLLQSDLDGYMRYQTQCILDNALNEKVALKMLKGYRSGVGHRATLRRGSESPAAGPDTPTRWKIL